MSVSWYRKCYKYVIGIGKVYLRQEVMGNGIYTSL